VREKRGTKRGKREETTSDRARLGTQKRGKTTRKSLVELRGEFPRLMVRGAGRFRQFRGKELLLGRGRRGKKSFVSFLVKNSER